MEYHVSSTGSVLTWYFPRSLVRAIARRQDGGSRASSRTAVLDRLDRGGRKPADLSALVDLVWTAWMFALGSWAVPFILVLGVDAATNGAVPLWLVCLVMALLPGEVSFAFILWLHTRAAHAQRSGRPLDRLGRAFLLPRRVNLLIVPVFTVLAFLIIFLSAGS